MATDNFASTNNPLASPWTSVSGMGAMESSGGVAFAATHDVDSIMVYSTSTEQSSQITVGDTVTGSGGTALINPSTGNGYAAHRPGGTGLNVIKYTAGAFDGESGVTTFTTSAGDLLRFYINGSNNLIISINGTDRLTWANTDYRTGLQPGVRGENEGDTVDDWTDGASSVVALLPVFRFATNTLLRL